MKKWLVFAVLVIIIAGVAWFLSSQSNPQPANNNTGGTNNIIPKASLYSTNGTVKQIVGTKYTLTLADGKTVKTFAVTSTTEVVKRVSKNGSVYLVSDKLSSVKVGSEVIVYSKNDLGGEAPQVTKIEITK